MFLSVKPKLLDIEIFAQSHMAAILAGGGVVGWRGEGTSFAFNLDSLSLLRMAKHLPGDPKVFHCKWHFWGRRNCWLASFLLEILVDGLFCSVSLTAARRSTVEKEAEWGDMSWPRRAGLRDQLFPALQCWSLFLTRAVYSFELGASQGHMGTGLQALQFFKGENISTGQLAFRIVSKKPAEYSLDSVKWPIFDLVWPLKGAIF